MCRVSKGCHGVAYRDGGCNVFDGTAMASFVQSNGTADDFKVMTYEEEQEEGEEEEEVGKSLLIHLYCL